MAAVAVVQPLLGVGREPERARHVVVILLQLHAEGRAGAFLLGVFGPCYGHCGRGDRGWGAVGG